MMPMEDVDHEEDDEEEQEEEREDDNGDKTPHPRSCDFERGVSEDTD